MFVLKNVSNLVFRVNYFNSLVISFQTFLFIYKQISEYIVVLNQMGSVALSKYITHTFVCRHAYTDDSLFP